MLAIEEQREEMPAIDGAVWMRWLLACWFSDWKHAHCSGSWFSEVAAQAGAGVLV
jgi:hypothetical protein